ncbi:MAG: hypothetical protein CM1200mP39_29490 [Dehalococcoidia bacterium]|nr:MAG: hypothetical protein CM1200mP39_29490 [Dehalococcoidia bacterium]
MSNPRLLLLYIYSAVRPLIDAGLMPTNVPISIHALSGYSGGGKSMIERWEKPENDWRTSPMKPLYALERVHKHIPEMQRYPGLTVQPQFLPAVGSFHSGMRVQVPLHESVFYKNPEGEEIGPYLINATKVNGLFMSRRLPVLRRSVKSSWIQRSLMGAINFRFMYTRIPRAYSAGWLAG